MMPLFPLTHDGSLAATLTLDGQAGGGQMLRSALSLSMITGQPFAMINIRSGRPKPGLMRQHLTCVQASAAICGARLEGAEIGSTTIRFEPGTIRAGDYHFPIGTAGSTSLLFQTLFPALSMAGEASTLTLEGGTHNPMAPPTEFLQHVFLPAVATMGWRAGIELERTGFAPSGGGRITARIQPHGTFRPCDFQAPAEAAGDTLVRLVYRGRPPGDKQDPGVMLTEALGPVVYEPSERPGGPGYGACLQIERRGSGVPVMVSAIAHRPGPVSQLIKLLLKQWRVHQHSGAPVTHQLADQLLLPMALGRGGAFLTSHPDEHLTTNIQVIQSFLPVHFQVIPAAHGCQRVICDGWAG